MAGLPYRRILIPSIDLEAYLIIDGEVLGPDDLSHAFFPYPILCCSEKFFGGFIVVQTLIETEKTVFRSMEFVVETVGLS